MSIPAPQIVLILGSAPSALAARDWVDHPFDAIVAINNAWAIRDDWTHTIHPDDFPADRHAPVVAGGQARILSDDYVPFQNLYGGVLYAGGTMAFTTGYWALGALRPRVMAFLGCDMVYPAAGKTHFYGTGAPDPLRVDISLRNLEAKSARLMLIAAREGCQTVNISTDPESRLVMPRARLSDLTALPDGPAVPDADAMHRALAQEDLLDYRVPHGRYWEEADRFDPARIDAVDDLWLAALERSRATSEVERSA